jgi:hypothetical protein
MGYDTNYDIYRKNDPVILKLGIYTGGISVRKLAGVSTF